MATQDALNEMAADLRSGKDSARTSAGLTPVAGEGQTFNARGIPDGPGTFLTNESVAYIARELRKQAAQLVAVADALDQLTLVETQAPKASAFDALTPAAKVAATAGNLVPAAKQIIEEADPGQDGSDFDRRYADLQRRAEAATYGDAPADSPPGWTCPVHPDATAKGLVSKRGRKYAACSVEGCVEFER